MVEQRKADIWKRSASRGLRYRYMDRFQSFLSGLGRPATGFHSAPEPRTIGRFARGRQMLAGNFLFAGHLVEAPRDLKSVWDLQMPTLSYEMELHGFAWLDDLAAVGSVDARVQAQRWLGDWIERYGNGKGVGWVPDLTGRRLIRWINHALFLLAADGSKMSKPYFASLAHQTKFLARRWPSTAPGLPRFEALTGIIYAGLSLQGMEKYVKPALKALEAECTRQIDIQGGIASRNPEELLEIFTLLTWASAAVSESDQVAPKAITLAIEKVASVLRALRHTDGGLARFHGGGRGLDGRLDQALAMAGVRPAPAESPVMGYARLSGGRTSIIVDVGAPPMGTITPDAHASTLALEVTSARRPLIVNCGPGGTFGEDWRRAGRATPSHSALCIEGYSSSRLGTRKSGPLWQEVLVEVPLLVTQRVQHEETAVTILASHDGYRRTHGLTHSRYLELGFDGRGLIGMDTLSVSNDTDRRAFDLAMDVNKLNGIPFSVRFHLHPEVEAHVDMGGRAVSLIPRSGEVWVFRAGEANLTLMPSVYLEKGRLKPRATKQIVLSAVAVDYETEVGWSLAKAQDAPAATRDLGADDLMAVD
jgi:uncharacterized heparinase superfamily protein